MLHPENQATVTRTRNMKIFVSRGFSRDIQVQVSLGL